jgi:hypothetical protein
LRMWVIWPIFCLRNAVRDAWERTGTLSTRYPTTGPLQQQPTDGQTTRLV